MKYAFIRAHREEFGVRAMCRVLRVHFSGFYAWLKEPLSHRPHSSLDGLSPREYHQRSEKDQTLNRANLN